MTTPVRKSTPAQLRAAKTYREEVILNQQPYDCLLREKQARDIKKKERKIPKKKEMISQERT